VVAVLEDLAEELDEEPLLLDALPDADDDEDEEDEEDESDLVELPPSVAEEPERESVR
jgi:hypothetical protein